MAAGKFRIKIKDAHDQSGMTPYAVAKALKENYNTIYKYATDYVESNFIPFVVVRMAELYGVDWKDQSVIEELHESPEIKTPLAVLA